MAKTIRTKVYKFDELSEEAKQKAIEHERRDGIDVQYIYDEAHESIKAFHNIFGTDEGSRSWLDIRFDGIDDKILELKGLRLQKYIWNNYRDRLYKGKYYNFKSDPNKQIKHKRVKSEFYKQTNVWGNYYYSAITLNNSCTLTGMCYDMDLLDPVYELLERYDPVKHSHLTLEDILQECVESLRITLEKEEEYRNSDEAIAEMIEANDYWFTKDGKFVTV